MATRTPFPLAQGFLPSRNPCLAGEVRGASGERVRGDPARDAATEAGRKPLARAGGQRPQA